MRFSTVFFVFLIFAAALTATAQKKTITNADLEKYRQERLAGEREYRETHARLGMPSPEELAKRNEASRKESIELAAKLMEQELERERMRLDASEQPLPVMMFDLDRDSREYRPGIAPIYYSGVYGFGRNLRQRGRHHRVFRQDYYVSGGSIWPVGPRTASRPMFKPFLR